jgi:hypothetical protein
MAIIISGDPAVESVLEKLVTLILTNGGRLHPSLEIHANNGELSAQSQAATDQQSEFIFIPESCLPSSEDFSLTLNNDQIIATEKTTDIPAQQKQAFQLIIELYNLTNKIATHRNTFPSLTLANTPELYQHLIKAVTTDITASDFDNIDDFIIETYLGSRYVSYGNAETGIKNRVIMPLIDCINHHNNCKGYKLERSNSIRIGLSIPNQKPNTASNECYARYGKLDALKSFFSYGFIDNSSHFVRSVPLTIDLGEHQIQVKSDTPMEEVPKIHPSLADAKYFMPFASLSGSSMEISHLLIPENDKHAVLRRILEMLTLYLTGREFSSKETATLVLKIEAAILKENTQYYKKLQLLANHYKSQLNPETKKLLKQLSKKQLDILSNYKKVSKSLPARFLKQATI